MAASSESNNNENLTENSTDDYKEIFSDTVISKLTDGFVNRYQPELQKTKSSLDELLEKQVVIHEQLHDENLKVSWTQNSVDLQKIFDVVSTYQNKLLNIKKDMLMIHDKSVKLNKRALRLKQHKEKIDKLEQQQRQKELKKEQDLIGKTENK